MNKLYRVTINKAIQVVRDSFEDEEEFTEKIYVVADSFATVELNYPIEDIVAIDLISKKVKVIKE